MSIYGPLARTYRRIPEPARRWVLEHTPARVMAVRQRLLAWVERQADQDELYDAHYYDTIVEPLMAGSAPQIARSIQREFQPRSVIDIGCGSGALLQRLQELGVEALGFELADAGLERCRRRGVTARRLDIRTAEIPPGRADVVVSTEVAEHLPPEVADRFVDTVTAVAPLAVITAAPPGSSGRDHVNEQPNDYWIAKFAERGFKFDEVLAMALRDEWRAAGVDEAFHKSLMVFRGSPAHGAGRFTRTESVDQALRHARHGHSPEDDREHDQPEDA